MDDLTITAITGFSGATATTALVWVVRQALALPPEQWKRVAPALSLVLGVAWNWLAFLALQPDRIQPWLVVLFGLLSGFAASGIWSGGKSALVEPMREAKEEREYQAELKARIDRFVGERDTAPRRG